MWRIYFFSNSYGFLPHATTRNLRQDFSFPDIIINFVEEYYITINQDIWKLETKLLRF